MAPPLGSFPARVPHLALLLSWSAIRRRTDAEVANDEAFACHRMTVAGIFNRHLQYLVVQLGKSAQGIVGMKPTASVVINLHEAEIHAHWGAARKQAAAATPCFFGGGERIVSEVSIVYSSQTPTPKQTR
eukprot:3473354-Amphidinium_carterae.1